LGLNGHLPWPVSKKRQFGGVRPSPGAATLQTKPTSESREHLANRPMLWAGTGALRGWIDLDLPNNFGGRKVEIVKQKTNLPRPATSRRWFSFLR